MWEQERVCVCVCECKNQWVHVNYKECEEMYVNQYECICPTPSPQTGCDTRSSFSGVLLF